MLQPHLAELLTPLHPRGRYCLAALFLTFLGKESKGPPPLLPILFSLPAAVSIRPPNIPLESLLLQKVFYVLVTVVPSWWRIFLSVPLVWQPDVVFMGMTCIFVINQIKLYLHPPDLPSVFRVQNHILDPNPALFPVFILGHPKSAKPAYFLVAQ